MQPVRTNIDQTPGNPGTIIGPCDRTGKDPGKYCKQKQIRVFYKDFYGFSGLPPGLISINGIHSNDSLVGAVMQASPARCGYVPVAGAISMPSPEPSVSS
jgi:hypothetical protein